MPKPRSMSVSSADCDINGIHVVPDLYAGKSRHLRDVDRGWAWIVLASAFAIHLLLFGITSGMGLFYSEFLDDFKQGPVATSWLIATNSALSTVSGPIGSILANKFGFRPVVVTGAIITATGFLVSAFVDSFWGLFCSFGIIIGFGLGIVYAPTFGILASYFDKRKNFATAFCTIAIGIGMFVIPPLERLIIAHMSWRGCCLILAGICVQMVPFAMFFVTTSVAPRTLSRSFSQSADVSLFKKWAFYLVMLHFFLMGAFNIFGIIGLRYVMDERDISADDAPLLISVQGACGVFGRLSAVAIGLSRWSSSQNLRFGIFHFSTITFGLAVIAYSVTPNFLGLMVVSGGIGFFHGLRYALFPGLIIDIFSAKRFSTTWSYALCILGVGALALPPLGEWIAITTERPEAPFLLAGVGVLVACTCTLTLWFCFPRRKVTFESRSNGEAER